MLKCVDTYLAKGLVSRIEITMISYYLDEIGLGSRCNNLTNGFNEFTISSMEINFAAGRRIND